MGSMRGRCGVDVWSMRRRCGVDVGSLGGRCICGWKIYRINEEESKKKDGLHSLTILIGSLI